MRSGGAIFLTSLIALLSWCACDRHHLEARAVQEAEGDRRGTTSPETEGFEGSLEQYRQVLFDRSQSLERFLSDVRDHYEVPALAAATVTLDGIQDQAVTGVKNYRLPEKVAIGDVFCIGSCGKSMTAAIIASMVQDGLVRRDT